LACIVSTDGYFKKVNPAWATTLGYTQEEVLATPMLELIHPGDLERTMGEIAKQSREHRTKQFVNRYRCKDGSYRLFEWTTTFNRDDSTRFGVARDITEQRLSEESLRESEERFRIMADSCPEIIWVTDAQGRTQLANRICREFFGSNFEQADGEQSRLVIHPEDRSEYVRKFLLAVQGRTPFLAEARVRRSDGEWRWIASHAEPRVSLSGDFLGHVGISPDITDRKQSEEALQRAKDAAEGANRSKSEFLANMSHEIRTPMNGVIGLTDLALDTELTPEQREYLEGVKSSADSLLRILNDILDFSKIEAGKLEFEVIEFDLRQTVEAILKLLGIRAAAKNLELACDFGQDVPFRVLGDPGRLRQILVNLTGNALKFTEHGGVVVRVERSPEITEELELHFSVKDTGIGIPLAKQQHVFRAFAQADNSSTRTFGGTGLGLTISSQLVEMMGGRIWLESDEGIGSTFHFTLRLGVLPARSAEELRADTGSTERLSVLVVHDNHTNLRILDDMLSSPDWKTTLANSGSTVGEMELLNAANRMPQPGSRIEAQPDPEWRLAAEEGQPGLRLLVVDDNPVNRLVATRLLEKHNHTVGTAANGLEALEMMDKETFDCVLMDIEMPVLDGFGATAEIRKKERNSGRHLPIVAMTAHAMTGDMERCLAAGMDGYITKPIKANDVLATVERVLWTLKTHPSNAVTTLLPLLSRS
jgi:PAS domain S-box-containing protein